MIKFSKREKDYLISIELKGHFTEDKIESVLHLTYKHLKLDIPALYIIDCRQFLSRINQERVVQFVNKRVVKNYMRYAIVVSGEVLSRMDPFMLNKIKLRNDTEMMIFETPKEAAMWCNSPIPSQYVKEVVSQSASETKAKSEQVKETPVASPAPVAKSEPVKPTKPVSKKEENRVLSMEEINRLFLTSDERKEVKEQMEKREAEEKEKALKLVNLEGADGEKTTELTPEEIKHAGNTVIKDPHSVYFVPAS